MEPPLLDIHDKTLPYEFVSCLKMNQPSTTHRKYRRMRDILIEEVIEQDTLSMIHLHLHVKPRFCIISQTHVTETCAYNAALELILFDS